jgi:hypothetical protein
MRRLPVNALVWFGGWPIPFEHPIAGTAVGRDCARPPDANSQRVGVPKSLCDSQEVAYHLAVRTPKRRSYDG